MIIHFQSIMNKNKNYFFVLHLIIFLNSIHHVKPQTLSDNNTVVSNSQEDSVSNFQPSLAVVIGMLTVMFCLTFILILYAKFCHQQASPVQHQHTTGRIQDGLLRSRDQQQPTGLDKTVIESLPFFRFSSLKGSKEGLECAVCLAKYEGVEVLRLLPKCKHAFHIDCIDQWLEKHSTCPLCRHTVTAEDLSQVPYSSSLRFLWNQSERREESNLELFVQREENSSGSTRHGSSSRFSIGSSFRKLSSKKEDELLPVQQLASDENCDENGKVLLHKTNHKIVVSDVVLKHRWSNVSSSDIMFLNSEMLNDMSSARFSNLGSTSGRQCREISHEHDDGMSIKHEMERKREFEVKIGEIKKRDISDSDLPRTSYESSSKALSANEKRSMSEIVVHPRFGARDVNNVREERRRKIWLPIARKTVHWFANRERSRPLPLHTQEVSNVV